VKELLCGDVMPGCETRLRGETEEELLQVVALHAQEAHDMDEVPLHLVEEARACMRDSDAPES
jgi:predicted small metal-binding protein